MITDAEYQEIMQRRVVLQGNIEAAAYWDGQVGLVALLNYVLNPAQIRAIFQSERSFFGV